MEKKMTLGDSKDFLELIVQGEGVDLSDLRRGTEFVDKQASQGKVNLVLLDFARVTFDLQTADPFNLVRLYEYNMPSFSHLSIALLVNVEGLEVAQYWEELCAQRGYRTKVFTDREAAGLWLRSIGISGS